MTMQLDEVLATMEHEDLEFMVKTIRGVGLNIFAPSLTIAPDGNPYLFRWHLIERNSDRGNVYLHLQIASDPERPLHDHPWDNMSVILAGGYDEIWDQFPDRPGSVVVRELRKGDTVFRKAEEAHRLVLPNVRYAMTLFTTGPKIREWGFWYPDGWHHSAQHVAERGGQSVHIGGL